MKIRAFLKALREAVGGTRPERVPSVIRAPRRLPRNPRIWGVALQAREALPFAPIPSDKAPEVSRAPFVRVAGRSGRVWPPGLIRRVLAPAFIPEPEEPPVPDEAEVDSLEAPVPEDLSDPVPAEPPEPEVPDDPEPEAEADAPSPASVSLPPIETQRYFPISPDMGIARLQDGHFLYVDPMDEAVGAHLIARGYWEAWIHEAVCRLVQPGDHIVEVGANFGVYTVAMARLIGPEGSLLSFEANPDLAALVERSIKFNGYAGRARVVAKAASDSPGEVSFGVSRRNAGGGTLSTDPRGLGADSRLITVPASRLDDEVEADVRLIRMDAEGSEPLILRGAQRLLRRPDLVVVMEWDIIQMASRTDIGAYVDWLSGMGFRFWRIQYDSTLLEIPASEMAGLSSCDVVMSRQPPPGGGLAPTETEVEPEAEPATEANEDA